MNANVINLAVTTFLHDLFTIIWIGGLFTIALTTLPAARKALGKGPQAKSVMRAVQRRHSPWIYISIVGLVVTGLLKARQEDAFAGLFNLGTGYSSMLALKHLLVVAMIGATAYRRLMLGRKSKALTRSQERLNGALLYLNLALGLAVLLISGFLSAGSLALS